MVRPPRIQWEGCWYHITSRGNERRTISQDDEERYHFLGLLGGMPGRYGTEIHFYVLMDNRNHLGLRTPAANLSRRMHWLNSGYSLWFNRRHGRCGHLLRGRFKGVLVEPQRWGLESSRYVHLNPIRVRGFGLDKPSRRGRGQSSGLALGASGWKDRVEYLRGYRWSLYRAYIGLEVAPAWLECREVCRWLGGGERSAPEANCSKPPCQNSKYKCA